MYRPVGKPCRGLVGRLNRLNMKPHGESMEFNPGNLTSIEIYKILTGSILPRPIAWVSTINNDGGANLAPFSFFTVASVNPPVLCFAPLVDEVRNEKDTLDNIRKSGEFVVNIVSRDLTAKMNQTSAPYAQTVNEFDQVGLSAQPSAVVKAPGVLESRVRYECSLQQIVSFGDCPMAGNLVLGDIRHIHLHPDIYHDGRVDFQALDPVGRLAGNFYATIRDHFEMARPKLTDEQ